MPDRTRRLLWTLLAIALPGPWTPVIVLVYLLNRIAERNQDAAHDLAVTSPPPSPPLYPPPYPPPDTGYQIRAYHHGRNRSAVSPTANWSA